MAPGPVRHHRLSGQSFFSFMIGVAVSMIGSLAVTDPEPRQQRVTAR